MNIEEFRAFCLSLCGVEEGMPFDDKTLVFYVGGKMFSLTNIDDFEFINLKCKPEEAIELREKYKDVSPGFHMNKKHWNSVYIKGNIRDEVLKEWIVNSYNLVIEGFSKKKKDGLLLEIKNRLNSQKQVNIISDGE